MTEEEKEEGGAEQQEGMAVEGGVCVCRGWGGGRFISTAECCPSPPRLGVDLRRTV